MRGSSRAQRVAPDVNEKYGEITGLTVTVRQRTDERLSALLSAVTVFFCFLGKILPETTDFSG